MMREIIDRRASRDCENTFRERVWHFKLTRSCRNMDDVEIAFRVCAYNILQASEKAWERLTRAVERQLVTLNCDYPEGQERYDSLVNMNRLHISIYDKREKDFSIGLKFLYTRFELINEQEWEELPDTVWKDYI